MAVDYDVFEGRRTRQRAHTLVRGTTVWDDGKIHTRPGHGRFVAPRDLRRNLMPFDPARAIADLRAIAELTGGPAPAAPAASAGRTSG